MKTYSRTLLKALQGKKSKYGNVKTWEDDRKFDSRSESAYYRHLKMRQMARQIQILSCQPKIYLTDARILYKPDFHYLDLATKEQIWVDVKGARTATFQIKKRLWECYGPGKLILVKKKGDIFEVIETIVSVSLGEKLDG